MAKNIERLLRYLVHVKKYPTSLRAAAVVSGLTEDQVCKFLTNTNLGFSQKDDKIYYSIVKLKAI